MTRRTAAVRLQKTTTAAGPLDSGLPQGSPASPVLFILYMTPLMHLDEGATIGPTYRHINLYRPTRFNYADDIVTVIVGHTLRESAAHATTYAERNDHWAAENGVRFGPLKTEVMHFSRQWQCNSAPDPPIQHGGTDIYAGESMRWLGVLFDRRLSFKPHIQAWSRKALCIANMLKSITNTTRGPRPNLVKRAVEACVIPVLYYGAEVWFPTSKAGSGLANYLVTTINSTLRRAMTAILPVWKTFPTAAMSRESGIPPALTQLHGIRRRHAARLATLDQDHPLAQLATRYQRLASLPKKHTRLAATCRLSPPCARPILLPPPAREGPPPPVLKGHGCRGLPRLG
jgi:hypothetical protein